MIVGLIALWLLFVQFGGDTITILNKTNEDICGVYFAYSPEIEGWGRNRILGKIRSTHSKDIRLPLFFEWFADDALVGYNGKLIDCEGNEVARMEDMGVDENYIIWTVR